MLVLGYSESELNSVCLPDSLKKILKIFEIFFQPSEPIGKTKPSGSFGSVCWNGSLGGLICLCWFLVIWSRNLTPFVLLDS